MSKNRRARTKSATYWIETLQPEVAYCYNCQARDSGEWVWVQGDKQEMDDLLMEFDVPEELWDEVAEGLGCMNCGTDLDRSADIGRKSGEERLWDRMYAEWHQEYENTLNEFVSWLTRYPYLGMGHKLGKQFMKEIPDFPRQSLEEESTWYRARAVCGPDVRSPKELGPPSIAPRSEGRFSHHGQIVFYLARDQKTAAAEALSNACGIAWIQRFSLDDVDRILDLGGIQSPADIVGAPMLAAGMNWSRALVEEPANSEWKPQYLLPRFIADCARACGFRGIIYPSTRFYGTCLVLFEWEDIQLEAVDDPMLFQWNQEVEMRALPF